MRSIRDLALNLLLSATSLVLFAGGIEWITRRIQPHTPFLLLPAEHNCMQRSPVLSVEFRPNCSGLLSETRFATNSLGMRGPEPRDDGSLPILALGDSCTWGWRVGQEEPYPAVLQQLLDARPTGPRHQLMNAGVPGYTSYQGLRYLEGKGLALGPTIAIIGFGFNDATAAGDVERQIDFERRWMRFIELDDYLLLHSRLYRWVRYRTAGANREAREERVPLPKHVANVRSMVDLATAHRVRVVLLNFWLPSHPLWYRAVHRVARERAVPIVDYDGPRLDVVHPTAEGDRLLAEQIYAAMERAGYLE
jgi:lysophospholipase L1-like esterase